MPLKILPEESLLAFAGKGIKKSEIIELMNRYKVHTAKSKNQGGPYRGHASAEDTKSAWFSVEEVLAFLKGNGVPLEHGDVSGMGLRIYFGMHHEANSFKPVPSIPGTPVESYYFKDTPILVVTKKGKDGNEDDQLSANDLITISGGGQGYDNARLCPPECNGGM
jgi:hypothetical protein